MQANIEQVVENEGWLHNIHEGNFDDYAMLIFDYQYKNCSIYNRFIRAIGKDPASVRSPGEIPFLPISFFKTHKVTTGVFDSSLIFESSGTTGTVNSRHYLRSASLYTENFLMAFHHFYGPPQDYVFLCLLPSYLERNNSSLVYMAAELIRQSHSAESGFYLNEWADLAQMLRLLRSGAKKVMLLGVTFALLDFAESYPMDLSGVIVMETGGMKGRKEEWTREQVHRFLQQHWNITQVHSEYGMTELLSQAYSEGGGVFRCAPTMKAMVRDENDPFSVTVNGSGCLNIMDLANVHSCSFIATDDIARIETDGSFAVKGRLDGSALRGCSLMVV